MPTRTHRKNLQARGPFFCGSLANPDTTLRQLRAKLEVKKTRAQAKPFSTSNPVQVSQALPNGVAGDRK